MSSSEVSTLSTPIVGRSMSRARRSLVALLLGFVVALGFGVTMATPSQAATAPTYCHTANIYENNWARGLSQSTYYCVYSSGANVYSVSRPVINGWTSTRGKLAGLSFIGTSPSVNTQCYAYNGRSRGYCVVYVTGLTYKQSVYGVVENYTQAWTQTRIWYNGYADCANAFDNVWVKCS